MAMMQLVAVQNAATRHLGLSNDVLMTSMVMIRTVAQVAMIVITTAKVVIVIVTVVMMTAIVMIVTATVIVALVAIVMTVTVVQTAATLVVIEIVMMVDTTADAKTILKSEILQSHATGKVFYSFLYLWNLEETSTIGSLPNSL